MPQRESRSTSCVKRQRWSCSTSWRTSRPSLPSSASPRSPVAHPTSSPRCTLSLSLSLSLFGLYIFVFSNNKLLVFWYLIWVFVFGCAERLWGCLLRRFWLWFHRSKRGLWEKLTRRRSTCHSICVPRRLGPLGEGLPSARYVYLRAWFIYAFFYACYFLLYWVCYFQFWFIYCDSFKVFCVFVYAIKYGVIEKCLIGNAIKFWNILGELL